MKKYLAPLLLVVLIQQAAAATFYDQLCAFNPNWEKYRPQVPAGDARAFFSDREYIQAHLEVVLSVLRSNPASHLTKEQLRSRTDLIRLLDDYRLAGNFPINYYRRERIPVFIDEHGTHCAVGYLMQQTGHEDLARRIAAADNYVWVKDLCDPEVPQWQECSGFSLEELKLIQGAYDYYQPDAFILPNKYEVPQKPACIVAYFENRSTGKPLDKKPENIWCRGEGKNGLLNGRWEQNYAVGVPWIVGFYENGKRTGQWEEYYQGTDRLCRTENWRNDKLNGIRRRFDREGRLIEEILFKDGKAVTKTNYDLQTSLVWIREPLDSSLVWTQVYTEGGALLASGHEKIYNPGNLLWFQNIELTALNSAAITARSAVLSNDLSLNNNGSFGQVSLYNTPPLVEYKKEGDWTYYPEYNPEYQRSPKSTVSSTLTGEYRHFAFPLFNAIRRAGDLEVVSNYDSIRVVYADDLLQSFYGYGSADYVHLDVSYHLSHNIGMSLSVNQYAFRKPYRVRKYWEPFETALPSVREIGRYNRECQKIGEWRYFDESGQLYKTESFILPGKAEEEEERTQVFR